MKNAFLSTWRTLFESPVHLDSALSKLKPQEKSTIAEAVGAILRQPVALAQACGIDLREGEPWSLSPEQLAEWPVALKIFEILQRAPVDLSDATLADYPPEMGAEWVRDWGQKTAQDIARELAQTPAVMLRVQGDREPDKVVRSLDHQGAPGAKVDEFLPDAIRFPGYAAVLGTEAYKDGWYEIQDIGSQLMARFVVEPEAAAPLLSAKPGAAQPSQKFVSRLPKGPGAITLVDACAGAGGKTLALSSLLDGKGRVYAYDISLKKIQALRRRATRAKLNNIQAMDIPPEGPGAIVKRFARRAQGVLVDAPCSGWGVLRRNPDIKWRLAAGARKERPLPDLQNQLLDEYSGLVAPGGSLVFGVCTIRRQETLDVVARWSAAHPEFEPREGGFTSLGWSDGFYMQRWVRSAKAKSV